MTLEEVIFKKALSKRLYLSTEPYFMIKDREKGEKDLTALAVSGEVEGAWLFTADDLCWRNISSSTYFDEKRHATSVSYHLLVLSEGVSATHYHTHPKVIEELGYNSSPASGTAYDSFARKVIITNAVIPSPSDIVGYRNYLEANPKSNIDFRIVSQHGITKIDFSSLPDDGALKRYEQISSVRNLATLAFSSKDEKFAIANMVDAVNREMDGMFSVSVMYRREEIQKIKPWYRRILRK